MKAVQDLLAHHQAHPSSLLPVLHDIQDALGYIPDEAVESIAKMLNLSRADVHGVITYYHHFRRQPPGRHVVQICHAEACQAMGAQALLEHAQFYLDGVNRNATLGGGVSLEPVYCLGLCACSPAIMIDEVVYARVTPKKFDALMTDLVASYCDAVRE